jgi:molecular chaperone DnaK
VIVGREARKHLDTAQAAVARGFVRSPKMALRRDPTDVVADVLRHLRKNAAARKPRGYELSQAVMTIPVDFGGQQRRALRSAARKAGISVIQFVHEPAAALYAYLRSSANFRQALARLENRNVFVFDWGGGTLDLSLCHIAGGVLSQISSRGNNEVGGDRFDERLRNLIRDKHTLQHGIANLIALEQPGASAALLTQCELAKIELSSKNSHTVLVRDYLRGSGAERNLGTMMPLRRGRPHHQPWPLRRIPDGRGRHPAKSVCRHPAADRGTAAAAGSRIDVKRLIVLRPIKNLRRGASG